MSLYIKGSNGSCSDCSIDSVCGEIVPLSGEDEGEVVASIPMSNGVIVTVFNIGSSGAVVATRSDASGVLYKSNRATFNDVVIAVQPMGSDVNHFLVAAINRKVYRFESIVAADGISIVFKESLITDDYYGDLRNMSSMGDLNGVTYVHYKNTSLGSRYIDVDIYNIFHDGSTLTKLKTSMSVYVINQISSSVGVAMVGPNAMAISSRSYTGSTYYITTSLFSLTASGSGFLWTPSFPTTVVASSTSIYTGNSIAVKGLSDTGAISAVVTDMRHIVYISVSSGVLTGAAANVRWVTSNWVLPNYTIQSAAFQNFYSGILTVVDSVNKTTSIVEFDNNAKTDPAVLIDYNNVTVASKVQPLSGVYGLSYSDPTNTPSPRFELLA